MPTNSIVPVRDFRIDPALTPALFAAVGALPERRTWYEVRDDRVCCCLTTALAATYSDLRTACHASDVLQAMLASSYEQDIESLKTVTSLPFPVMYLAGLIDGWDGTGEHEKSVDARFRSIFGRPADQAGDDCMLFAAGRRDGRQAFAALSAIDHTPIYPLASADYCDIHATGDDDYDPDDEEEFDDERDDGEDDEDPDDIFGHSGDDDDDWDDEDDL